jgi:hypothetical protein
MPCPSCAERAALLREAAAQARDGRVGAAARSVVAVVRHLADSPPTFRRGRFGGKIRDLPSAADSRASKS